MNKLVICLLEKTGSGASLDYSTLEENASLHLKGPSAFQSSVCCAWLAVLRAANHAQHTDG